VSDVVVRMLAVECGDGCWRAEVVAEDNHEPRREVFSCPHRHKSKRAALRCGNSAMDRFPEQVTSRGNVVVLRSGSAFYVSETGRAGALDPADKE
jgi:hypothetical protein